MQLFSKCYCTRRSCKKSELDMMWDLVSIYIKRIHVGICIHVQIICVPFLLRRDGVYNKCVKIVTLDNFRRNLYYKKSEKLYH